MKSERVPEMLRVLFTPPADGPWNMAVDVALLRSVARLAEPPTLRLYRWRGLWVSIGYSQEPSGAVDLDACDELGIGVVRRPTGGKGLLHGLDLTYSLTLPSTHRIARASVAESHAVISRVILEALGDLGVAADLVSGEACAPEPARPESAPGESRACFDQHRQETVRSGGRKLVGSAQARRDGGLLQHGSIPLSNDYELLARLFCPSGQDPAAFAAAHRAKVTSFSEASPGTHPSRLAAALTAAFSRALGPADACEMSEWERREAARQLHPDIAWWRV